MSTVFDLGMYDGEDTSYYLDAGLKVATSGAKPARPISRSLKT